MIEFVQPFLDQLQKEMAISWNLITGDMSIVDDLDRFKGFGLPGFEAGMDFLKQFDEWASNNGYENIFGKTGSGSSDQAMQGVIKGVSAEMVSVLIGLTNAIRIYQADMANNTRISVGHLASIAQITSFNKYLVRLEAIENTLGRIEKG